MYKYKFVDTVVFSDCVIVDNALLYDNLDDALLLHKTCGQLLDVTLGWGMVGMLILRHIKANPGCTKVQCINDVIKASKGSFHKPKPCERSYYYGKFNSLVECFYMIGNKLYLTKAGYSELTRLESYCSIYQNLVNKCEG